MLNRETVNGGDAVAVNVAVNVNDHVNVADHVGVTGLNYQALYLGSA